MTNEFDNSTQAGENQSANGSSTGAGQLRQEAQAVAQDLGKVAKDQLKEQAEAGKEQAAKGVESLSAAIDEAASSMEGTQTEVLAEYARKSSEQLAAIANMLHERSLDEIAAEARQLARTKPMMFMLGSVVVGFGLSRFLKASQPHEYQQGQRQFNGDDTAIEDPAYTYDRYAGYDQDQDTAYEQAGAFEDPSAYEPRAGNSPSNSGQAPTNQ